MSPSRCRRRWLPSLATVVAMLASAAPAGAETHWSDRRDTVWQDGGEIHAMAWGDTEEEAEQRARNRFLGALRTSLPELDADLASPAAVIGDRRVDGDSTAVRLDFPARFGEACRGAHAWYQRGVEARKVARDYDALHAFAHAAWLVPADGGALDTLGIRLANLGYWGSAAVLYDAAAAKVEDPPASLLRNRAAVHILMGDVEGARKAIDALRAYDPSDPDLSSLESNVYGMEATEIRLTENPMMPDTPETMDSELVTRYLAWSTLDESTRRGLIDTELAGEGRSGRVTMGPLQFDDAWGTQDEHGRLLLETRGGQEWVVGARRLEDTAMSALAYAGSQEVVAKLVDQHRTVLIGDLYPLGPLPHGDRFDEGWLRAVYHAEEQGRPDRLRMIAVFRWEDRLYRIDIDGPLGSESLGRPGLLTAPMLTHMLLEGVHPTKGGSDR